VWFEITVTEGFGFNSKSVRNHDEAFFNAVSTDQITIPAQP
jgi:hypothetical protein